IITTILLIVGIYLSISIGHLQGFTTEQQDETYIFSMNIGIDMVQFSVFTVILAVIAAVIDLTITISSPMYELNETNPT
ncbi:YibE/F family protein, partial [Staphylococcus aureus]|nr:YibE/F family protein [Staphylococcus aureus]